MTIRAVILVAALASAALGQEGTFDSGGVPIHYLEAGKGVPVVLIHGNGGSAQDWVNSGVFASLAADYYVIAMDCRGFGKSGKPHSPADYGPNLGLDVVRLLDHLHIAQAHVIGYSLGANVTMDLLVTHPERFISAVLGGAVGRQAWTEPEFQRAERAAAEWESGRPGPALYATALAIAPTDEPKPSEDSLRNRQRATLANPNFDRVAQAALMRSFRAQAHSSSAVEAVRTPLLGIVGSVDPALAHFNTLKGQRPSMTLAVIDKASHSGPRGAMRRPEFIAAIRDFLSAQRGMVPPQPREIDGAKAYVYKTVDTLALRLHVFSPPDTARAPRPAIVLFFGGGWHHGPVSQLAPQARYLASRGMVTIVADYRVSGRHGTTPFEAMSDAKSAIRWVRANASRLGLDPNRLAAGGASSGGQIALATALFDGFNDPRDDRRVDSRPGALVLFNPAVDPTAPRFTGLFAGRAEQASPLHQDLRNLPPTIIFHGTADTVVDFSSVDRFCSKARSRGRTCQLVPYEGANHGFYNPEVADGEWHRATLLAADQFLTKLGYLRP